MQSLIAWSLNHRLLVLLGAFVVAIAGFFSLRQLNIDAFPDTTPVQVQINAEVPGMVATEVERLVTYPIELLMGGLPGLVEVRSISQFGVAQVTVTFADGTELYRVRELIGQRLGKLELPPGTPRPELGPVATGLGEVFHYLLYADDGPKKKSQTEIRSLQDWTVRPQLRAVPGTAEINAWGGLKKQYQVRIDPALLFKYDITFENVIEALRRNNLNVGGGYIDRKGDMLLVHGIGRASGVEELQNVQIIAQEGVPIYVKDVANVVINHEMRRGVVTADGRREVLLGLGFMRTGENSYAVTGEIGNKFKKIEQTLPEGVEAEVVYDRTELVGDVIATVRGNLCEGALLVVAILFLFLGNLRAGLIAAAGIPLCMLFAFTGMQQLGIAGTLLSLGAIDFGIVVDSSVVMIENIVRKLAEDQELQGPDNPLSPEWRLAAIQEAATEVRKPAVFGQLIIMIVYLPILTLEGVEGKMFLPMALTVILVLLGSLVMSLTLTPVLASAVLPRRMSDRDVWIVRLLKRLYQPCLRAALSAKFAVLSLSAALLALTVLIAMQLGTEFIPKLSEGAIVVGVRYPPGTSYDESARNNLLMEKALMTAFPNEISHVWSRAGEPDVTTDAGAPETTDMFVRLNPRHDWKRAETQIELVELMEEELADFKGRTIWFTQPIEMRLNEMLTGIRSDVAIKLYGEDLDVLTQKAGELERVLHNIPGCADLAIDDVNGQPILQICLDRNELARYGIPAESVLDVVESVSGKSVGHVIEGQLRFPLAVRLPEESRQTPYDLSRIMLTAPSGEQIPLSRIARFEEVRGAKYITRDWSDRYISIQCNIRGRDMGSFVAEAQDQIEDQIDLPPSYHVEWGGQFENMRRAQQRLLIVVPLALGLIVALLFVTFRNTTDTIFVFLSVPFACIGGVAALWAREMPLSISAAVGFITLSGVSVLSSMVLVSAIRRRLMERASMSDAIKTAAVDSLRTIVMTALVASVGFVPMATSLGVGAEVQRPLATVVIGGVMMSMLMTLFVLPVLYASFAKTPKFQERRSSSRPRRRSDREVEAQQTQAATAPRES